jgi:hypothetical protein
MQALHDEVKAKQAKEESEKVIQNEINRPDEVDHEYESTESRKLAEKQSQKEEQSKEDSHKIGQEEINILDQAVMNTFKKHLSQIEEDKKRASGIKRLKLLD